MSSVTAHLSRKSTINLPKLSSTKRLGVSLADLSQYQSFESTHLSTYNSQVPKSIKQFGLRYLQRPTKLRQIAQSGSNRYNMLRSIGSSASIEDFNRKPYLQQMAQEDLGSIQQQNSTENLLDITDTRGSKQLVTIAEQEKVDHRDKVSSDSLSSEDKMIVFKQRQPTYRDRKKAKLPETLVQPMIGLQDYVVKLKQIAPSNSKIRAGDFSLMSITKAEFENHVRLRFG